MQFQPLSLSRRSCTCVFGAAALVTLLLPGAAHAQAGFTTDDTQLLFNGTSLSPLAATARAGFTGSPTPGGGIVPIFVYRLGALTPGTTITSAVLSLNLASLTVAGGINYNVDLYGIGFRTTPTITASDFYVGPLDTTGGETLLQDNFVLRSAVPTTPARIESSSLGSAAIAGFLNAQYAAGATAGNYVFFRLSPDASTSVNTGGYDFSTQDNTSASGLRPLLTITTGAIGVAPEPGAGALMITALPLLGLVVRRRKLLQRHSR